MLLKLGFNSIKCNFVAMKIMRTIFAVQKEKAGKSIATQIFYG